MKFKKILFNLCRRIRNYFKHRSLKGILNKYLFAKSSPIVCFVIESPLKSEIRALNFNKDLFTCGWGNGYVAVPEGHPWYGKHYNDPIFKDVRVHGGLTFSQKIGTYWVLGFDTAHFGDNETNWPREHVVIETMSLEKQAYDAQKEFEKRNNN